MPKPIPDAMIGIDVGTRAVKAVMIDASGALLAAHATPHPTARPGPGLVEQDPADWITGAEAALDRFAADPGAARVGAVGVTSQVNTHAFCGADLTPLAPAITWQDTRAASVAARLEAGIDGAAKARALGAPIPIDASHALARMAWMAAHLPDVWAATRRVLLPKDVVIARLTGAAVSDPISAVGLVGPDLRYAGAVLALLPGAAGRLPPLLDPLEVAGHLRAGPFAGLPVVTGTMDAWASMIGLGAAAEGEAFLISGTSEVAGLISATRTGAPGIVTFPPWAGLTVHMGPTQAGGASLEWLARLTGREPAELARLGGGVRIAPESPLFLPHLEGERAPLWDAGSRGGLAGLAGASGPAEIAAAVMEGVAFSARLALEAAERSGAMRAAHLRVGGGATSDAWCRIRADALGRTLHRVGTAEIGAAGAAALAAAGCGLARDLRGAALALARTGERFEPEAGAARIADERFARYRALYAALRPVGLPTAG